MASFGFLTERGLRVTSYKAAGFSQSGWTKAGQKMQSFLKASEIWENYFHCIISVKYVTELLGEGN